MTRKDIVFFGITAAALCLIFAPCLISPGLIPANFGDIYAYHYPLRHLAASTLQEGRIPLWNPYIFAGTPFAANPQAVLFYPGSVLHYVLPVGWALSFDEFLHALLACLGATLLLRRWGLGSLGAWVLSMSFGLSPFVIGRIAQGIPTHLAALAWCPWVWLFAESGSIPLMTGSLCVQWLSGHPQFAVINLLGLGLRGACASDRRLVRLAVSSVGALALGAAQWLPTFEFLRNSVRAVWDSSFSAGYSLSPVHLLSLLSPAYFGDPRAGTCALLPSEFFEMLRLHIGIVPMGLALYGARRVRWAWLLIAAGLFLALGENNPFFPLLQKAGLGAFRVPARFSLLILLGLWALAAGGWQKLGQSRLKLVLAAGAVVEMLFWTASWVRPQRAAEFLNPRPEIAAILRDGGYRVAMAPELASPNKMMLYRIPNISGYEAFYLARIAYYAARSEKGPAADGSRLHIRRWDSLEMSRLGLRWYLAEGQSRDASGALVFPRHRIGTLQIFENPRAERPGPRGAESERLSPEHVTASGIKNGLVILPEAYAPGWRAYEGVRRLKVLPAEIMMISAEAGDIRTDPATIHFLYLPASWVWGLAISLLAWVVFGSWGLRLVLRSRPA